MQDLKFYQESNFLEKNINGEWCLCSSLDPNKIVGKSPSKEKIMNGKYVDAAHVAYTHSIKDSVFDMTEYRYEDTLLIKDLPMCFLEAIANSGFTLLIVEEFTGKSKEEIKLLIAQENLKELNKSSVFMDPRKERED